ncbi:LysR family substrate-binding domain-containing protein [Actinomycetospora termitidis]|uniref:LysR family substrate-binding domain-containing protein n=1 Tax=Actinomycetospora termitidis TaxID=3053470 RepID=A0ABT7MBW5_9PSEU|nr:LysR family substrate-binding domain-containing protein [Actinomycetospora sp. Odt1-22]MDL5158133.1 LysR family substrate-binding domain-containing protein [Actinomycetospora sp. Odt1-22]
MTGQSATFRLGFVAGVTPDKWARMWAERLPGVALELEQAPTDEVVAGVRATELDAGLVRLPIDRDGLHAIPLYTETTVVVVPKDHVITVAEEATLDDLADEVVQHPQDDTLDWADGRPGRAAVSDPATTADAIELVAAGVGLLVLPLSLARLHHRRDLTHRALTDAPTSTVALTWPDAENSDEMEELIGIVRGRTVNSSRTPRREAAPQPKADRRRPPRRGARRR